MIPHDEYVAPSKRWQAFTGALPFIAFGISSMIGKVDHIYKLRGHNAEMVAYSLILVGFLIEWIRGFPMWSYSYLGWSLVLAWSNTNIQIYGTNWGYRIWIPFGITLLIALLWTRSLNPIRKFFRDIWNDWTHLSLAMYSFIGFMFLIYDENHHPYLLVFMSTATLTTAAGAWFTLRSSSIKSRTLSLAISSGLAFGISSICEATWDYHAYYGLAHIVRPWYSTILVWISITLFLAAILFWPISIQIFRNITIKRREC